MRLEELPLLAGAGSETVAHLAARLVPRRVEAGEVLMTEGEEATFFAIVLSGEATVSRRTPEETVHLGTLSGGDVVGELGPLLGRPRLATVTALTGMDVLTGDSAGFGALLETPGVHDRMKSLVSRRLAEDVNPVALTLRDGTPLRFRPLLPGDREAHHRAVREASAEFLRRRFFTPLPPSQRLLDYLVDIDFVDHFAWVCLQDRGDRVGDVRYIRNRDRADMAEFAFSVEDAWQGRGVGTLLLGAIAVAADAAGVKTITASFLHENTPVRVLLTKVGATFGLAEPGVADAQFAATAASELLAREDADLLRSTVTDVVHAAGLALTGAAGRTATGTSDTVPP